MGSGQFFPPSDFGVGRLASQNPVVIFSKTTCCMCHSVWTLFQGLKVRCVVHELDQEPNGTEMERVLINLGRTPAVPAVFIGGALIGGTNEVMALHLSNSLVPMLTHVGAL